MANFSREITYADVDRYQQLRQTSRKLMTRIVESGIIPHAAYDEIGAALGIMRKGILILDTVDVSSVLTDCCLHDFIRDGENLITKFRREHPATPGTDEDYLLRAHEQAVFRLARIEKVARGAGAECVDALNGERFFLMDVALGDNAPIDAVLILAGRTIPLDGYWATTGAPLPVTDQKTLKSLIRMLKKLERSRRPDDPHQLALTIVRTCLDAGAAKHVRYAGVNEDEDAEGFGEASHHTGLPRISRNAPCPCGSGKKYKRCCMPK